MGDASTIDEDLSVDDGPPKVLQITIRSVKHLPKMDALLGKCDPFITVSFDGQEKQTKVIKKVYDATFGEKFSFELDPENSATPGELVLVVWDWERVGANDKVGEVRVKEEDMVAVVGQPAGWVKDEEAVVTSEGKNVKGHDGHQCTVSYTLEVHQASTLGRAATSSQSGKGGKHAGSKDSSFFKSGSFASFSGSVSTLGGVSKSTRSVLDLAADECVIAVDENAEGARELLITVVKARHLPKMDMGFLGMGGKVDAFCELDVGGVQFKTEPKKGTYDPDWGSTFTFSTSVGAVTSPLVIRVMDWNQVGAADLVGEVVVSRARLGQMVSAQEGWKGTDTYIVQREGGQVVGHDKNVALLTVSYELSKPRPRFPRMSPDKGGGGGARVVSFTVVKGSNLPSMDTFGRCDGFVELVYEGSVSKTEVVKNSYDPDWSQTFDVRVDDCTKGCAGDVLLRLFDWNKVGSSELVGEAVIPKLRMGEVLLSRVGSEDEEAFELSLGGKPVLGHNKEPTTVTVRVGVGAVKPAFASVQARDGVQGGRRVRLTVRGVSHLPKMDGLFGKCDPYIVVQFEGEEYRTKTVKGVYDAEFGEAFDLDVEEVEEGVRRDCFVRVYDWDAASKDDEVGEVKISAGRMSEVFRARIGTESSESFPVMAEGKPVIGHDKKPCELSLSVEVMKKPVAFAGVQPDAGAAGARRLMVTLCGVRHLPKMDGMFGKCDPYAVLQWEGAEYRTETVKNTYDADWDQGTFAIDVDDVSRGTRSDLIVEVWDWDAASKDDLIGSLKVPAARVSQLFAGALGSGGTEVMAVMNDGKAVVGHDKGRCEVTLRVKVCEAPRAFPTMLPSEGARGARRLLLTVKGVRHLPRMDGMFGKCDPFLTMQFDGVEHKTEVVKNSYEADFDETFALDVDDVSAMVRCDCLFTVWDWDMASQNDEIGTFTIPGRRMVELFQAPLGATGEETMIVQKDGKAVVGNDHQKCQVQLQARVCEVPPLFESLRRDDDAKGPRKLTVTVVSCRHLPKKDVLLGTVDPYVTVKYGPHNFSTEIVKNNYSPNFGETFDIDTADVLKPHQHGASRFFQRTATSSTAHSETVVDPNSLVFTVMDWDMVTADDLVGSFVVPPSTVADLLLAEDGWEAEVSVPLWRSGRGEIVGHDKQKAKLTVRFQVSDVKRPVGLSVAVQSLTNAPSTDPLSPNNKPPSLYCQVSFCEHDICTSVQRDNWAPEWASSEIKFEADRERKDQWDLVVRVYDDDGTCWHEPMGEAVLPGDRVAALLRGTDRYMETKTLSVTVAGKPLLGGKDSEACEMSVQVTVLDWEAHAGGDLPKPPFHPEDLCRAAWRYHAFCQTSDGNNKVVARPDVDPWLAEKVGWDQDRINKHWQDVWSGLQVSGLTKEAFVLSAMDQEWDCDPSEELVRKDTAVLHVEVEGACNLPRAAKWYVSVRFNGTERKTRFLSGKTDPVWSETVSYEIPDGEPSPENMVGPPFQGSMAVMVMERGRLVKSEALGGVVIGPSELREVYQNQSKTEWDWRTMPLMRVKGDNGDWDEVVKGPIPEEGSDAPDATIKFRFRRTPPEGKEVIVVEEEEEEELTEVHIDALRNVCLCYRLCDQLACKSRWEVLQPDMDHCSSCGDRFNGDLCYSCGESFRVGARQRFGGMFLCPILMNYHVHGKIRIIGI